MGGSSLWPDFQKYHPSNNSHKVLEGVTFLVIRPTKRAVLARWTAHQQAMQAQMGGMPPMLLSAER
jgi:hypothetical protein